MDVKLDVITLVKDAGFEWSGSELLLDDMNCTDEALDLIRVTIEQMALFVEWRGRTVGGAIDPRITAKAIRALKP